MDYVRSSRGRPQRVPRYAVLQQSAGHDAFRQMIESELDPPDVQARLFCVAVRSVSDSG